MQLIDTNPETHTELVENFIKWCVCTYTSLKRNEKFSSALIWSGELCLETPACAWMAVLVLQSSRFPVEQIWGTDCISALRAGQVKLVNFRHLLTGRESAPRPHQNVRVNKSNQTRRTRGHFVRLHDKLFWVWDYSKEGKLNLFAEMLIEQLFLEFANRDTECKPKFVVQTRSSADKGRWWFYSILGLSKKRGRTRISGPRGLRAGWAGGAPATFVVLNPRTPSTWIPPPRMPAPVRPAEGAPSPEGGGTALRRK